MTPGDDLRAVGAVAQAVERALAAGQALDDELRVAVDDDRHYFDPLQRDAVERDPAVLDAVGDELADARRVLARAAGALEPRLELDALRQEAHVVDAEPDLLEQRAPLLAR